VISNQEFMTATHRARRTNACDLAHLALICLLGAWPRPARAEVSLAQVEYAGLAHYKITTPAATYFLERSGAGLSRLLDRDGNDWLSFEPTPGTGAGGEFRGFPNAVDQQAGNYFHPRNKNTDISTAKVEHSSPSCVTISAIGTSCEWACRYEFFRTHCIFTMTKMSAGFKYWVLYEGTPGGQYHDTDWWMTSDKDAKSPLTTSHEGDIPAPEWIAFGDAQLARALVLWHHEDDDRPDCFYQMQNKMTVFGFGRQGSSKFLDSVPQRFSIGFVENGTHDVISRELLSSWQPEDK
jgi:hypothetical protein